MLTHPSYRADIDGLRAIAVFLVIGYHYFPNHIPGGFIGVDIFFVISGYLISSIIMQKMGSGQWSYASFYTRRINRIFPALALVLAASLVMSWVALVPDELRMIGKNVAAGSAFLVNFALWNEAGYFDNAADTKPLLHLWSLAIEEQFYIVWPVILAVTAKFASQRSWIVLLPLGTASLVYSTHLAFTDAAAAYYSPLSRFYELALGGLIAYATQRGVTPGRAIGEVVAISGLLLIGVGMLLITPRSAFPGLWGLFPTAGAAALIWAGQGTIISRVLAVRPMVWVGLISYPLYLWHWPTLVWTKILTMSDNVGAIQRIGLIALSMLLAWATYLLVERPIKRRNTQRTAIALAGLMTGVGLAGLLLWSGTLRGRHQDPGIQKVVSAVGDWAYPTAAWQVHKRFSNYTFYRIGNGNMTLFVGDSNAEQYAPRVEALVERRGSGRGAIFATKGSCPFASPELARRKKDCADKLPEIRKLISSSEVSTVVFAQQWTALKSMVDDPRAAQSLERQIASISKRKRVYIVLGMPLGEGFGPADMLTGSRLGHLVYEPAPYRDASKVAGELKALNNLIRSVAARQGAIIIDPFAALCSGWRCRVTDQTGRPAYKDRNHLSGSFVRDHVTYLDRTIQ